MGKSSVPFILAFVLIALSACTKPAENGTVSVRLPAATSHRKPTMQSVRALGAGWGVADPTSATEINCYAIVVEGTEGSSLPACTAPDGSAVLKPEVIYAFVPGGKEISIDVKTGAKKFSILGLVASPASACVGIGTTSAPQYASLSTPQVVASKDFIVNIGDNKLDMTASLTGATKIDDCGWSAASASPTPTPSPTPAPPSALSYSGFPITYTIGTTISATNPTVTGTVDTWSISPALPAGLSFDTTNGEISGTPTTSAAAGTYTITASNSGGSTTTTISITVVNAAPSGLSYSASSPTYTYGTAISANSPTVTGTVTSWSVSPALPTGLSLNSSSGDITGTPTATVAATAYTVTAANDGGSTTATVTISVSATVPTLSYTGATGTNGIVGFAISISPTTLSSNGSSITGCGIKAATTALPAGLSVDSSCVISGTMTTAHPPTTYTLVVTNAIGPSADATVTLSVAPTWEWIGGSSLISSLGTFGTKGTASVSNVMPARSGSVKFQTGTKLWMFGGIENYTSGCEMFGCEWNDLWSYETTNGEWTWVSGGNTPEGTGNYGTQGSPSASNSPPARSMPGSWTDGSGNLWLFGGNRYDSGFYYLNDLWKFDTATGQWTWVRGSNGTNGYAVYGTKGVAMTGNDPGARSVNVTWTTGSGLYMHGGYGYDASGSGQLADLWKYDPSTTKWVWIAGPSTVNVAPVYGTMGLAHANNHPGARENSVSWVDSTGKLWLYGGQNSLGGPLAYLNDLWMFDPATGNWTWVAGQSDPNKLAIRGTLGVEAVANTPGSRAGASGWVDANGDLFLFGGVTCIIADAGCGPGGSLGQANDVWKYSVATGKWAWISGSSSIDQNGNLGTISVVNQTNIIGGRNDALAFHVSGDAVYLFGGYGFASSGGGGYLNDLWKFHF